LKSKGLITRNTTWQAKQSTPHITVTFYGDWAKMCEDFALNFGDKRAGCYITTSHRVTLLFSQGNI
jgi:hypothetical protein